MTGEDKEFIRVKECITENLNVENIKSNGGITIFTLDGGTINLADAKNLAFNTTTGTKIGTATNQKLGFWGATPAAQAVFATGQTTDQLITFLQGLGLCRQS